MHVWDQHPTEAVTVEIRAACDQLCELGVPINETDNIAGMSVKRSSQSSTTIGLANILLVLELHYLSP